MEVVNWPVAELQAETTEQTGYLPMNSLYLLYQHLSGQVELVDDWWHSPIFCSLGNVSPRFFYISNFRTERFLRSHLNPTSHFSDAEKNGPERLNELPKVTQRFNGRVWIHFKPKLFLFLPTLFYLPFSSFSSIFNLDFTGIILICGSTQDLK